MVGNELAMAMENPLLVRLQTKKSVALVVLKTDIRPNSGFSHP